MKEGQGRKTMEWGQGRETMERRQGRGMKEFVTSSQRVG